MSGNGLKQRGKVTKARKPFVWIVCEGENKSERLYFQAIRCEYAIKYVKCGETDPPGMMNKLIQVYKQNDGSKNNDLGYCIVDADLDPLKNAQMEEADHLAAKMNAIELIVSAPCFEIWFLCHLEYSTRQYASNDKVLERLREHAGFEKYKKSDRDVYGKLRDKLPVAIRNAKRLEKEAVEAGKKPHTTDFSPTTEVYKIIQAIQSTETDQQ